MAIDPEVTTIAAPLPSVRKVGGVELRFTMGNVIEIAAFLVAAALTWGQLNSEVRDQGTRLNNMIGTQNRDRNDAEKAAHRIETAAATDKARLERILERLDSTLATTNQTLAKLGAAVEAIQRVGEVPRPR